MAGSGLNINREKAAGSGLERGCWKTPLSPVVARNPPTWLRSPCMSCEPFDSVAGFLGTAFLMCGLCLLGFPVSPVVALWVRGAGIANHDFWVCLSFLLVLSPLPVFSLVATFRGTPPCFLFQFLPSMCGLGPILCNSCIPPPYLYYLFIALLFISSKFPYFVPFIST